jgi:transposase
MSTDATPLATSPFSPPPADPRTLPDDPAVLKQMIVELLRALSRSHRNESELQQRLDALLRHRQRLAAANPNQPLLFAEEAVPEPPPAPAADEAKPSRRGKCKPHGRRRPAANLRREPQRYELTAAERLCPECGTERQEIGVEVTEQLDYKPAEVFVIEHQRVKYACKCCAAQVTIAPKPAQPLDRGLPGPGLLAQLAVDKYQDHLPLYRSEARFARLGVTLPRSTTCDWMA